MPQFLGLADKNPLVQEMYAFVALHLATTTFKLS
jgi:hypothetical protein